MEGITLFISVIFFICGILQIILFFKIWGMTNNVYEIKNLIESSVKEKHVKSVKVAPECNNFVPGDIVVYEKTRERFKIIKNVDENRYDCEAIEGGTHYILNSIDLYKESSKNRFNIGDIVIDIKRDKQVKIKEIKDGKYLCYSNGGITFDGEFEESEIKFFSK